MTMRDAGEILDLLSLAAFGMALAGYSWAFWLAIVAHAASSVAMAFDARAKR